MVETQEARLAHTKPLGLDASNPKHRRRGPRPPAIDFETETLREVGERSRGVAEVLGRHYMGSLLGFPNKQSFAACCLDLQIAGQAWDRIAGIDVAAL